MTDDRVTKAIFAAIESLNDTLPPSHRVPVALEASLRDLESLAITNLIVAVEDAVREHLGVEISLTDEATLALLESPQDTPMRSIQTLVAHVAQAVERQRG